MPNPVSSERIPVVIGGNGHGARCHWRRDSRTNGTASTSPWMGSGSETSCSMDCLREEGRDPADVRRTLMTGVIFGRTRRNWWTSGWRGR